MKRPLRPEELKVWSVVAGTVRPLPGRSTPMLETATAAPPSTAIPIGLTEENMPNIALNFAEVRL